MSEDQPASNMTYAVVSRLTGICLTPSGVVIARTPMQAASSHSVEACHDNIIALGAGSLDCWFNATPSKEPAGQTHTRNERERSYSRVRREQAVFQKAVLSHCRRFPGTRHHCRPESFAKPSPSIEALNLYGVERQHSKIETWRIRCLAYSTKPFQTPTAIRNPPTSQFNLF